MTYFVHVHVNINKGQLKIYRKQDIQQINIYVYEPQKDFKDPVLNKSHEKHDKLYQNVHLCDGKEMQLRWN